MTPSDRDCAGDQPAGRSVRLPVIGPRYAPYAGGKIRPSRMGRWRAAALILIHVLFIGHLLHWGMTGRTLTPIEPSETMETLETGRVNAGALFFAAALAATLVFGRFVCGWGCHIVALQDLCGWLLRRAGLRPKPFRSRLLVFVPLGAAIYMFVWPSAYRWWHGGRRPALTAELTRTEFWATFPGPVIAVLTLLICGFAIVYFLGNKGFCTYACPYGGFFGLLDQFSPGRIRVTDACNGCGHCTAVCSSNVRVAEEVRLYGMVVDPGCMKCMDCVSVCPNDALYFGLGRPAALARGTGRRLPVRFDGTWAEEIGLVAVFFAGLACYRGLYGQVPFLFSLGLSAITAFLALKAWHLVSRRNVTMHHLRLKHDGRLLRAGRALAAAMLLLGAFVAHSGLVQLNQWRGQQWYDRVMAPPGGWELATTLRPAARPEEIEAAAWARQRLSWTDRWGFFDIVGVQTALSWLDLLDGEAESAERRMRRLVSRMPRSATMQDNLAAILLHRGRADEARAAAERAAALDPELPLPQYHLGLIALRQGDADAAAEHLARAIELDRHRHHHAGDARPVGPIVHHFYAEALRRAGRLDESLLYETTAPVAAPVMSTALERATRLMPADGGLHRAMGLQRLRLGDLMGAVAWLERAVELDPGDFNARMHRARVRMASRDAAGAVADYAEAERFAPDSWQVHAETAEALTLLGRFDEAIARGRRAAQLRPAAATIRGNLGAALVAKGELGAAAAEYEVAVTLDPDDMDLRLKLGILLAETGRIDEARAALRVVAGSRDENLRRAAGQLLTQLGGG